MPVQEIDKLNPQQRKVIRRRSGALVQHTQTFSRSTADDTAHHNTSMVDAATPLERVSAFCRAVLLRLLPKDLWGEDSDGQSNSNTIMQYVDQFVRLRRFENLSLHTVFQKLKVISASRRLNSVASNKYTAIPYTMAQTAKCRN